MSRCPKCTAILPQGAQWCSLCYADLRQPVAPAPVDPVPVAAAPGPGVGPVSAEGAAPDPAPAPARSGRHAKRNLPVADPLRELDFDLSDEQLFEILRSDAADPLTPWRRRLQDPRFKWGMVTAGAVGLITMIEVIAAVVGSFVHT